MAEVGDIVRRCQAGDAAAFRELFRQHRAEVGRLAQRMLGRSNDLEDVVQEVFVQVHRSLQDFRGESRFSTWLYRVTVNVVLMHRRAARSRPQFIDAPDFEQRIEDRRHPDEEAARNGRVRALYRLLERLSEKKRTVFVLHELEGLSYAEVSGVVEAPVLTVRTRLFYARKELAAMLGDEPELAFLAVEFQTDDSAASAAHSKTSAQEARVVERKQDPDDGE